MEEKEWFPNIGDKYWYVRSDGMSGRFKTCECSWCGGISDAFRMAKANVYPSEMEAERYALILNERLDEIVTKENAQRELLEIRSSMKVKGKQGRKKYTARMKSEMYERRKHKDVL